ncbi:PH domain-containing protein [Calycomorphotria hydatis]|uniref:Bacterial membrane flanked domain protein n=1 Tax=Calycomorphotria hydatis TaxID=2528027 RepID=A0A517T385_9PLAN|nr:PH domain-containing protein [Calycomorphotria hydatis]QDT62842.1 Bacterial membrane flanked domain protein [Calycomorphotria hydatis]
MADSSSITYRCPRCSKLVGVTTAFIGKILDCPNCGLPFQAKAPVAEPVFTSGGESAAAVEFNIDHTHDDEKVLERINPAMFRSSPIIFSLLTIALLASFIGTIASLATGLIPLAGILIVVILCVAAYFAWWYLETLATTFVITNKRSRLRTGLISKSTTEVQHDDIRNLQVNQSIWQRMFDVGDLAISSSGQDDLEIKVKGIPDPNDLANDIRKMQ